MLFRPIAKWYGERQERNAHIKNRVPSFLVCALLLLLPPEARAEAVKGHTTAPVDLYWEPGSPEAPVSYIPAGETVEIVGCLKAFNWCEIAAEGHHGWMDARFLEVARKGDGFVNVVQYGAVEHVPVIVFEHTPPTVYQ